MVVLRRCGGGVNPRQHKKDVNECPPRQQKAEVQVSKTGVHFATLAVRLKSQGSHEWDAAQEEQNVAGIQPSERPMKINLVIGPLKLPDHPYRAAQGDQHPEDIAPPVWRARIEQQPGVGYQRHDALNHIPEHDQHLRATRMRQGNTGVQRKDEKPYSYGPGDRAGGSHTRSDSSIEPRSAASAPEIPWISQSITASEL